MLNTALVCAYRNRSAQEVTPVPMSLASGTFLVLLPAGSREAATRASDEFSQLSAPSVDPHLAP